MQRQFTGAVDSMKSLAPLPLVPDEEAVAVVNDVVLEIRGPRFNQRQFRVGVIGVQETPFRHIVAAGYDVDETPAVGFAGADEETGILFLIDEFIVGRVISQRVPVDAHRPVMFVKHRVVEGAAVVGPFQAVVGIRDGVGQRSRQFPG